MTRETGISSSRDCFDAVRFAMSGIIEARYALSGGKRRGADQKIIHLVKHAYLSPRNITKIAGLLRRKSRGKPVPFFLVLLDPQDCVEDVPITAAWSAAR